MYLFENDLVFLSLFSFLLFFIGLLGTILPRSNLIIVLMSVEIILLSISLNFIFFSVYLDDLFGQICALIILTIAASESAVGLAILVTFYRFRKTLSIDLINYLKG